MIDHLSIGVGDVTRSAAFYDAALAPLGYKRRMEFDEAIAFGREHPTFWVSRPRSGDLAQTHPGFHLCFVAPDRAAVDAFHAAALAQGAQDDGAPGLRPHYHESYYAAFVVDPDGYRIEAVTHRPE